MKRTDKNSINWPVGINRNNRLLFRNILKSITKHLQLSKDIVIMCSGGLDSTVLAHATRLSAYQSGINLNLYLLYVNHQLRPSENQGEVSHIYTLANELGATPLIIDGALPEDYDNLQDIARKIRYKSLSPNTVAFTAHHANDQAETKLFQFITGRKITGIQEIISFNELSPKSVVIRPLLSFTKKDLRDVAEAWGWVWCEDSSNRTCKYTRNKLRNMIIPLIEREVNPNVIKALAGA